ncbi:MAG: sulfatase [Ignavibacteriae bacterium]|nr:sulfatase [Ignavibacteriota bacterium]
MKKISIKMIAILIVGRFLLIEAKAQNSNEKMNVVFILVDDLGWSDVGFNNPNTFYETKNLDQLAKEGTIFTNAYAACPVCSPTRASIMTGKYPARLATTDYFGAYQPEENNRNTPLLPASYEEKLPLEEITIAEHLKSFGYKTFFAGKWHLGPEGYWPEDQGFDINKGGITRGGPYGGNKYFSPYGNPRLSDGPEGEHLPSRLADETVKFIKANKDQQFFAYLSFYSVHTPLIGRPDLVNKYKNKAKTVDSKLVRFLPEGKREARQVQDHAVYAAMVEAMDLAVGKVLTALDELKLNDKTIVIFMSDNGGLSTSEGSPTSNLPLRAGKGWLYEGGIREPMIIKWPQFSNKPKLNHTPVISTDFYPTILEMCNLPLNNKQHLDGVSLVPLLKGESDLERKAIFWHYPHYGNQGGSPGAAIRYENLKFIDFFGDKPDELYDLENDIGEKNNLIKIFPDKANELKNKLSEWQKSVKARFPATNKNFDPTKKVYF